MKSSSSSSVIVACCVLLLSSAPVALSARIWNEKTNDVVNITLNGINIFGLENFGEIFYYEDQKLVGYEGQVNSFDLGAKSLDTLKDAFVDKFRGPPGTNTTLKVENGIVVESFTNEATGLVFVFNGTSPDSNPVSSTPCADPQSRGFADKFAGPIGPITDIEVISGTDIVNTSNEGLACFYRADSPANDARSFFTGPQGPDAVLNSFNTTTIANFTNYGKVFIYNDKLPVKFLW
ncbi:hypothetical protein M9435_003451 [Picochlorum sp. BPE23]|nr:hypothetical protein M9435_003451 [Picochlorum sp. BPE23]